VSFESPSGGGGTWGSITGTLSNQTDLQNALNAKFDDPTGTTSQYLRGDGSLATFPAIPSGTVTSVGLTMPSAFSVANSPITTSGTLAVTGAGTAAQYIRGDGQLANFPDNQGGGSSVNYYLNGSVTQGTFGGDTYYEMSKTPILGAGTNFTRTNGQGNGYIASFITDAGDPSLLNIPGGNWNLEFYFQSSASGGSPQFYGEVYKVSSANVFTLVASGSTNPEGITNGTTIDQYFTSIPVPQTSLLVTDRLAVRIYVIPAGRTITLHTEDGNLCEVLTTLSTGLNALNGLTAQVQYFATGTSGTDFAISSATDTHTFNLPTASATNRGALSSADWTTFNNKVPASRTLTINGVAFDLSADRSWTVAGGISGSGAAGQVAYWTGTSAQSGSADLTWDSNNLVFGNNKGFALKVAGTNRTTNVYPTDVADNFAGVAFYPSIGTNVAQAFQVIPRGTGFASTIKAQFSIANTDTIADPVNWEGLIVRAAGTAFTLSSGKGGSATLRPILLSSGFADGTTNANHLWLYTTGNVGVNTSSDGGQRLQVQGTTLLNGNVTFSSATGMFWDASNSRLGVGTNTPNSTMQIVGSSATTALLNITNNSTLQYPIAVNILFPSITSSSIQAASFYTGKALTTNNGYGFSYIHVSDGSSGNRGSIAFYGVNDILSWYATGNVSVGGTTDSGQRLQVQGTTLLNGNVTFSSSTGMTWDATNSRLGVGTNSPAVKLDIVGNTTNLNTAQFGTIGIQSYALNNAWYGENLYFNGSGFVYRATGFGSLVQFFNGQSLFTNMNTGTGGVVAQSTNIKTSLKIDYNGSVAIGGNINSAYNNFTGASLVVFGGTGNLAINSTSDTGERLQVTGTMKVTGNINLLQNHNLGTTITLQNTTAGTGSSVALYLNSTSNAQLVKYSSSTTSYKIFLANDLGFYNQSAGDISILNDFATGNIKFAAGGSSTPHMTIKSNGRINMSSLPTSSTGLVTGDLWNDAGTIKIV
jgi:hypothetical protein